MQGPCRSSDVGQRIGRSFARNCETVPLNTHSRVIFRLSGRYGIKQKSDYSIIGITRLKDVACITRLSQVPATASQNVRSLHNLLMERGFTLAKSHCVWRRITRVNSYHFDKVSLGEEREGVHLLENTIRHRKSQPFSMGFQSISLHGISDIPCSER